MKPIYKSKQIGRFTYMLNISTNFQGLGIMYSKETAFFFTEYSLFELQLIFIKFWIKIGE